MTSPTSPPTGNKHGSPNRRLPTSIPTESFTSQSTNITYTIERAIGRGGYGVVYSCFDPQMNYFALKTSKKTPSIMFEIAVMKEAETRKCKHFGKIIDQGWAETMKLSFFVMELLGPSLSELKAFCINNYFGIPTTLRVAMQTLNAIDELHEIGFISRDVKPSNFVASPKISKRSLIYMIDFGISKRYKDDCTDFIFPPKEKCSFRGTARYCSIKNHLRKDQGRKDDCESWMYMCSELANGKLLWSKLTRIQRQEIFTMKMKIRNVKKDLFIGKLPDVFKMIFEKIDSWEFETKPEYGWIYSLLDKEFQNLGASYTEPYDWEYQMTFSSTASSSSSGLRSNTPTSLNLSENEIGATQEETDKTM